ncbi:MAG: hypothetical protein GY703_06280 [Gammaproteobacteria bacterium]|nr:hypothetical protein [Gammaproteobacteria bacterium]
MERNREQTTIYSGTQTPTLGLWDRQRDKKDNLIWTLLAAFLLASLPLFAASVTCEYDALHRLTQVTYLDGTIIQYHPGTEELNMRITITIEDTDDGQINVTETRVASDGEMEESVTSATALADAMFEVMDQLGEVGGTG